ncbi:MAG: 2-isopropylmalate synthase [Myxococcales bacterium]|nr:2-isopropylmalate synthase [Myxococcales bacterium]
MSAISDDELIFDWNVVNRRGRLLATGVTFFDETLRDGIQNPSVTDPKTADKLELIHLMDEIGIHVADIGLPGSGKRNYDDVVAICQEIDRAKLKIRPAVAGRTVVSDITPMIDIAQKVGMPLEVYTFIGSSPIRQLAEAWDVETLVRRSAEAIDVAVKAGLPVCYVTEDTTRSRPDVLATLFKNAIDHGATRLCLSDTVGHATPDGVRNLLQFTKSVIAGMGLRHGSPSMGAGAPDGSTKGTIGIDWHGHNDRGFALENAIWALEFGADRVHGTALGIGERVGNAQMELILMNLKLLGELEGQDTTKLVQYCETAARACHWQIPINYPLVGRDAFRTSTGVHAAAIIKAEQKGDAHLADRIYSGVPAGMFGRGQDICIGFMSGASNEAYWLKRRGFEPSKELIDRVLARAKQSDHILSDEEVLAVVNAPA